MKYNVLLFWFEDDWGYYGRTYEMVARHLAEIKEIQHVACIFPPVEEASDDFRTPLSIRRISGGLSLLAQKNIRIPLLEKISHRVAKKVSKYWVDFALKHYLHRCGFAKNNTILWLFPPHPYMEKLLTIIPHAMAITQVVDNFLHMGKTFWLYDYAKEQYPKLATFSDLIITSSRQNQKLFSGGKILCRLYENAVDPIFLGQATNPRRLSSAEPPKLGYVGWITERTDLDLLAHVARCRPEWSLILAGPQSGCNIDKSTLSTLPNVEIRAPIAYPDVPEFIASLDVCLIPHRDTAYSRSMSPLKLYQYLASGKPIVSTSVAGVEKFADCIFIAKDPNDFINCIDKALKEDTFEASSARIESARKETWDIRIKEMFSFVTSQLTKKHFQ